MFTWLDNLVDARAVRAIFGATVPSLTGVVLHEVCLHRDGPRAVLRFDLPEFPEKPPRKWLEQGLDQVQIQLMLVGVRDFSMQGWSNSPVIDLSIVRNDGITASGVGDAVHIGMSADAVLVASISAYATRKDKPGRTE